jgi:hypothetical protein
MPTGGDIREITWNHPTLGSGRFLPKAGEDSTYDLGGYKTDDSDTNVDSGGNFINSKQRKPWMFQVSNIAWDMKNPNRQELEQMQAMSDSFDEATFTMTNINGVTYMGTGTIVGDIQGSGKDCTISFKIMGGGTLQSIS